MTDQRPAYEQVTITHGGYTVTLRPSLRAATILENRFGFPAIDKGLAGLDFIIISEIIRAASVSRQDAAAFLGGNLERPLSPFFEAVIDPVTDLIRMFAPAPVQPLDTPTTGNTMTWAEIFAALYDCATGALGWTPETAWNATPTEIERAHAARIDHLVTTGVLSRENKPQAEKRPETYTPERLKQIEEQGFDPSFDRASLRALKAKIASAS